MKITAYDAHIEIGEIPTTDPYGDEETVYVARVGRYLHFSQHGEGFAEEVAGEATRDGDGDFELSIAVPVLRRALRRSATTVGEDNLDGQGKLVSRDPDVIAYVAPCGDEFRFDRADLEEVLAEFGGR